LFLDSLVVDIQHSSVGIEVSRRDLKSELIDWSVHAHFAVAGGQHIAGRCQHLHENTVSSRAHLLAIALRRILLLIWLGRILLLGRVAALLGREAAVGRWWSSAVVLLVRHRVDLAMLWLSDVLGFGWLC
jgi:hypothetical protein